MPRTNGVDTVALEKLRSTIASDASKGKAQFQVRTTWEGGTKSKTHVDTWKIGGTPKRRFSLESDCEGDLPDEGTAANPQEMLMAALNACMLATYVGICSMKGIELDSLEIETRGQLDLRGYLGLDPNVRPGYEQIDFTVRIKGNGTREQFQQVHDTVLATSPNHWNMTNPVQMCGRLVVE